MWQSSFSVSLLVRYIRFAKCTETFLTDCMCPYTRPRLQLPLASRFTSGQVRIFLSYLQLSLRTPGEIRLAHGPFPRVWAFADDLGSLTSFDTTLRHPSWPWFVPVYYAPQLVTDDTGKYSNRSAASTVSPSRSPRFISPFVRRQQ